jgi:hypothetical protein
MAEECSGVTRESGLKEIGGGKCKSYELSVISRTGVVKHDMGKAVEVLVIPKEIAVELRRVQSREQVVGEEFPR